MVGTPPAGGVPTASPDAERVLVVGYGSVLRSDDGVGWAVVRRLVEDPRFAGVDVRGEPQLAPELALDASGASLVILIDAAADLEPGTVRIRAPAGAGRPASAWTHHIEPDDLIALTRELWGSAPPVVMISVGVASLEVGESLTAPVEAAVPRVVDAVADAIARHRSRPSDRGERRPSAITSRGGLERDA